LVKRRLHSMMEEDKIAPHVEDIKRVLGEKVEDDVIEADLRKYLEQFMVPLSEAKRSVVKKYDGDPQLLSSGEMRGLAELKGNESSVDILCRLITVNMSESPGRDGGMQKRFWGLMEDGSRTIPYTAWNDHQLRKGEVLRIHNAYTRMSPKGEVQVNLGDRASVTRMPEDSLPPRQPGGVAGGGGDGAPGWTRGVGLRPVGELEEGMSGVEVKARVLTVRERTVTVNDQEKQVYSGVLADASGQVNFSAWHDFGLTEGSVVRVVSGYVKMWRDAAQFTFDERSTVEALDDGELPLADELALTDISLLREGMGYVVVRGRVLNVSDRTVDARGETKTVYSGELADRSGSIPFSAWHDFGLVKGQVIQVAGGYVRSYRGPQLSFDERSAVSVLGDDAMPPEGELAVPAAREISRLIEAGGGNNVSVQGVVLDIKEGSGLVFRCTGDGCNRVLQSGSCMVHGKVDGRPDLRIKAIIDDGTGALSVFLGREPTAALLGRDVEQCVEEARERMGTDFVRDELIDLLVARPMRVSGNVISDDFGTSMIGRDARLLEIDVKLEAQKLLEEMGV